ncbi:putative RNA helicase armi [Glossina fuscipes fuscipes]
MCNRERAHFTRQGKYLALDIENLSECRPSLVIGDRVKAENPWADGKNGKEMYIGAIHEVLRNRILIRFDDNFHREYDYRHYRLEFCLARYGYRKQQHYAISRAAENGGSVLVSLPSTPSSSSADLITSCLLERPLFEIGDLIRVVSHKQLKKGLDTGLNYNWEDEMIVTESGLKMKSQMEYLGRHRVTIGTCATLGNFLLMGFPPNHFTHVLIDDADQCTEPKIIVAVARVSNECGRVILAGDPNRQTLIINEYARGRGLSTSFLRRVLSCAPYLQNFERFPIDCGCFDPRLVLRLLNNYLSLPSILNVYNELVIPGIEEDSREAEMLTQLDDLLPQSPTHGIFFHGLHSENMQERDSPSWYNPHEAKHVFLMTVKLYRKNIRPEFIGIITPYEKQVKRLRKLFDDADVAAPKIGTVEDFLGQI